MRNVSRRWIRIGVIGAYCALGCSSQDDEQPNGSAPDGDTSASDGADGARTNSARCEMVTQAEAKSILGIDDLGPPGLLDESSYRAHCSFETPRNPLSVSVIYNTNATQADYDLERNGYIDNGIPMMDLSDFGDAALTSTLGPINTVFVLAGKKMVQVAAVASLDKVRTLTELYLERL